MTLNLRQATLGITCATALVLTAIPSFAAITGHNQLETIVTDELKGLGVSTEHVKQLTLGQIAEPAVITESSDSPEDKKAQAQQVIDKAIKPQMMTMGNAGAMQLEAELKADLESVGIALPKREKLTFAQVMELTAIFDSSDSADRKAAVEKVLGMN